MQKGEKINPNHPKKGDSIKVDPIRNPKDIKTIKNNLVGVPRDYCLFVMGTHTCLRASDLRLITAGLVRHLKEGDDFEVREKKTGKFRRITVSKAMYEAIQALLSSRHYNDTDPLFFSQRGKEALSVPSIHRLVKSWCKDIRLPGNFGSHTLRKTFGYQCRKNGVSILLLMDYFNHATQKQTLNYLGIQAEEMRDVILNINW